MTMIRGACDLSSRYITSSWQSPHPNIFARKAGAESLVRVDWSAAMRPCGLVSGRMFSSFQLHRRSALAADYKDGLASRFLMSDSQLSNCHVLGVDPDVSGAIALLHHDGTEICAQVVDVPAVKFLVGKMNRRKHDSESIVALVKQLGAPEGSVAYIEEPRPFPKDGKQGWYGCGFGYGVWTGILFALGFQVVPVRAQAWKAAMGLLGTEYSKDDSRALACKLFPTLAPQLRRKKDHGRAEALLIAAFGTSLSQRGTENDPGTDLLI